MFPWAPICPLPPPPYSIRPLTSARDRRERRALQRGQLGLPPAAAVSRAGPAGQVELDRTRRTSRASASRIRATSRCSSGSRCSAISRCRRQRVHADRTRRSGTADRRSRLGRAAADAGPRAVARPQLLGGRGPPGGERVVLISHRIWQQRFNRDPSILGQALTLDGAPYTIIGVLPAAASAFPLNQIPDLGAAARRSAVLVPSQLNNGGYLPFRRSRGCGRASRSSRRARP